VIPHGGSTQVAVTVKPGDKAPAGTHWLSTRVYSADAAPEEDSVTSDRVTFEIDAAPKKPNPKWGLWASIAAALVVVVCVVLFLVLRSSGPEMIAVPRVTEMPQSEAEQLIKNAGLLSDDVQKFVYGATVGNVVSQAPAPETPVAKGSPVTITVAAAPKFVPMPPVIGISYEDADAKIRALGLIPIEFRLDHNTAAKNIVFNSDPLPDKPVLEGNKVSVYVSTGNPIRH
jgi:beta-lactam-binding protein with PASTA domain